MDRIRKFLFQNIIFGLLALLPVIATIYVFMAVLEFSDDFLFNLLPMRFRPQELFGRSLPGFGVFMSLVFIFLTGVLTRNFVGRWILRMAEGIMSRIPVVRTLYSTIRQFMESIFMDRSNAFRKAVLLEYPRKGLFTIAFVTSISPALDPADGFKELYTVFVPTTPNPTSGFFLVLRDSETYDLNITVQEAFRLIISGGVISGGTSKEDLLQRIQQSLPKKTS